MFNESGVICTLQGRTYTKSTTENSIVANYYDGSFTYPLLIGETPDSVKFYTNAVSNSYFNSN